MSRSAVSAGIYEVRGAVLEPGYAQQRRGDEHTRTERRSRIERILRNAEREIRFILKADTTANAIRCKGVQAREEKSAYLCGVCKPVQPPATHELSLVMSR
jgi:hypothetical protein